MECLEDRIVSVVAGGASGIGEAVVRKLVDRGDKVIIIDKDRRNGERVSQATGAEYHFADITDPASIRLVAERIASISPHYINHLAVTAGGVYQKHEGSVFEEVPDEEFKASVELNLFGPFYLIKNFLPSMKAAPEGQHKSITLPGSSNMEGGYGLVPYSSAKAGLVGLARSSVDELGRHGITINVVEIGGTKTPALPERLYPSIEQRSPLKRMNTPDDVAGVYRFLASPEARNITGAVIPVNFGQTIARR